MAFSEGASFMSHYLYENESTRQLKIPTSILVSIPHTVILKDKYDNTWQLQTRNVDGQCFFMGGWNKFAKDNALVNGDMVGFDYLGHGVFNVNFFDSKGWDKKNEVESSNILDKKMLEKMETARRKDIARGKRKAIVIEERQVDGAEDNIDDTKPSQQNFKQINCFEKTIFEAGVPKPKGTYFVAKVNPKRMYEVRVPVDIVMLENHHLPKKITLVDPYRREYPSTLKVWSDRKLYNGWGPLCKNNNIKEGDIFICEFGKGDEEGLLFINFMRLDDGCAELNMT